MAAFVVVVLLLVSSFSAYSQGEFNRDAEKTFTIALKKFNIGEFADAANDFEQLTNLPPHHRTTAAYVMLGKSYFRIQQFRESIRLLKHFVDTYPGSEYTDDAHYTLGLNYEAQSRYDDALIQFLAAVEITKDSRLRKRAFHYTEKICDEKLTAPVLSDILTNLHTPESEDYVRVKLAEKYLLAGNIALAEQTLLPASERTPPSPQYPRAEALLQSIRMDVSIRIGILLPLMNRTTQKHLKTYGEEFLQGMQFSLDEQRNKQSTLIDVELEIRDTERDPSLAAKHAQELALNRSVVAIVGPIFNNEVDVCANIANAHQIPLVTPTANADGIASRGEFVFQLNPDNATRGRAAARYAVVEMGFRTVGVVAPAGGNGKIAADAFVQEAELLGARVAAKEWYPLKSTDLREYLRRFRRASLSESDPLISFSDEIKAEDIMRMIEHGAHPRTIDSLLDRSGTISVYDLFGPDGKRIADELKIPTFVPQITVDSLEIPAEGIQCVFVPINEPQEIGIVTSQFAYFNIKAQILGSNEWYNTLELDANRRYADGVIFTSDFYFDSKDTASVNFANRWFEKAKRKVSPNVVLGYDAMRLVASIIYSGITSREALRQKLASVERLPLIRGMVTLTEKRVNNELHVLQFISGEVKKIGELSVR